MPGVGSGSPQAESAAGKAAEPFSVNPSSETTGPSSLIDRLQKGELSVDQYLEERVEQAVAPFSAALGADDLEFVKSSLRAELESDPVLVELASRATGGGSPRGPAR